MITIEVAVFTTPDADACEPLQKKVHADLATFEGYVGSLALRGLADAKQRADLVLWSSNDAAQAAATVIRDDPRFADFMGAIGEIRHFGHYPAGDEHALEPLREAPVTEIAAYRAKRDMSALQEQVHEGLKDVDGAFPVLGKSAHGAPRAMLDLIGWKDAATHAAAPKQLMVAKPELAAFFEGVEQMHVFELYEVVR